MVKTKGEWHQIVIHPNRWLGWAIAYSIIVAVAMLGYIKVSDVNFQTGLAENTYQPWQNYRNSGLGFSVKFPSDWSIEADSERSLNFVPADLSKDGISISVEDASVEKNLRLAMDITSEKQIKLDGIPASKITNRVTKNASETVVLAKNSGKLYVISGSDEEIEKFILTFNFLSRK